jgi:hypothetical protein
LSCRGKAAWSGGPYWLQGRADGEQLEGTGLQRCWLCQQVEGVVGLLGTVALFSARVARSRSRLRKLCSGRSSSVRRVVALRRVAGDRSAGATIDIRSASAAAWSFIEQQRRQALAHVELHIVGRMTYRITPKPQNQDIKS